MTLSQLKAWSGVAIGYALVTVVMATPFVDLRQLGAATFGGDGRLVVWTIAWVSHQPIVNGYGRGEPPEYLSIVEQLSTFPSAQSAGLAMALGVRYFVVHANLLDSEVPIRQAGNSGLFKLVARDGSDYLFEVVKD